MTGAPGDKREGEGAAQREAGKDGSKATVVVPTLRIVGGVPTARFPACCCLADATHYTCSGILIAPSVVLTASHCAPHVAKVMVGATDIKTGRDVFGVRAVIVREPFDEDRPRNDLAVVILSGRSTTTPMPLATSSQMSDAAEVTLVGFGYNDPNAPNGFGIKREADVGIAFLQRTAKDDFGDAPATMGFDPAIEFVAGRKGLGRDTCNGDSGGPALILTEDGYALAGITSRSTKDRTRPCGDGGIYTRVDRFAAWLKQTMVDHGV